MNDDIELAEDALRAAQLPLLGAEMRALRYQESIARSLLVIAKVLHGRQD